MAEKNKNKFDVVTWIGYLAILVIVISLLTLGMRMTGYVTSGTVNVTVTSSAAVNFSTNFINFSSGTVYAANANATLESNGTSAVGGSWTWIASNFTIQNIGNVNINITNFSSGKTAAAFIGGTGPGYSYSVENAKLGSCQNNATTMQTWTAFSTGGASICGNISANSNNDTIAVFVQLVIPKNSNTGNLTDTVTAAVASV